LEGIAGDFQHLAWVLVKGSQKARIEKGRKGQEPLIPEMKDPHPKFPVEKAFFKKPKQRRSCQSLAILDSKEPFERATDRNTLEI